jgi:hypothetical protein
VAIVLTSSICIFDTRDNPPTRKWRMGKSEKGKWKHKKRRNRSKEAKFESKQKLENKGN